MGKPKCGVGNPCDPATGNKYLSDVDYVGSGPFPLIFERFYNSLSTPYSPLGKNWRHSYDRSMQFDSTPGLFATIFRPDGKSFTFRLVGSQWLPDSDVPTKLEQVGASWQFTNEQEEVESYDSNGRLTAISNRAGVPLTLQYYPSGANDGRLQSVTDAFGRSLIFQYDSQGYLSRITGPDNHDIQYSYYTNGFLKDVTYQDGKTKQYVYNESAYTSGLNLPHALTGIIDENGTRFAIYQYDNSGKAKSTEHAGGADKVELAYSNPTTTNVTSYVNSSTSATRAYSFAVSLGVKRLTGISGPACPTCGPTVTTYDSNGFVASSTDWNGNLTMYLRQDPYGRLDLETSRIEASGSPQARTITTEWHPTFRLPATITEPGRRTSFSYDPNGNLLSRTVTDTASSKSRTWGYTYNTIGQVLTIDGPRTDVSDITTYTYYPSDDPSVGKRGNIAAITIPVGHVTQITAYDANGRPLVIVDSNGLTTTLTYHPRGWLAMRTVGAELTTYDYDNVGQLKKVTLPDASFVQYTYDAAHRLTQIADNLGNNIVYTLDAMGNRTAENVRDPGGSLAQTRSRVYNSLNRLIQDIGGASPATQVTQYGYDNQGNLTTIIDPLNHVTTNAYDALNRLKQVTDPALGVTQYAYNPLDQLTAVTDPRSNATVYSLDALDNLNQQVSPDTGTTVNTYDSAGNVLTSRDAKNQTTAHVYDALNRVTRITYHDGSQVNYTYDQGVNGKGRLSSIVETAAGGALTAQMVYAFDAHGRMTSETRTLGTGAYLTQYGFDAAGRLSSMTYPSGRQVAYSFDAAGRIAGVTTIPPGGAAQTVVANVAYHPFGGVKGFTYGNGQTYTRTIDLDGRIAGYTLGTQSVSVGFDAASRITSLAQGGGPGNTYGYDALDRLASAVMPTASQSFGYDPVGNRTAKTIGAATATYAYPAASNRLASITSGATRSFTHDPSGSIVSDGINGFTYDARGRLIQAATALGSVSYGLNALGQRYAKTVQGVTTLFHYDAQGHLIAETGPAGNTLAEYLYLGDIPVAIWR